jgi:hypothetical protein
MTGKRRRFLRWRMSLSANRIHFAGTCAKLLKERMILSCQNADAPQSRHCFDGSCASPGIRDPRTTAEAIALVLRRTSGLADLGPGCGIAAPTTQQSASPRRHAERSDARYRGQGGPTRHQVAPGTYSSPAYRHSSAGDGTDGEFRRPSAIALPQFRGSSGDTRR